MAEPWTARRVVAWIQGDLERRGFSSPRLEADLLVCHALGLRRIALYTDLDRPLVERELSAVRALVERRRSHEPIAYILGEREFYSRPFSVNRDVLIPRPDTETLVEVALALIPAGDRGPVAELCVGSGAVIVTLLCERPELEGVGTDLSTAALAVAAANAARHGVGARLTLAAGDLFAALPPKRYAALVVNPPYIPSAEIATLDPDVRSFEPTLALDGGADGLDFYRRIAREAAPFLAEGASLALEVGHDQAAAVAALLAEHGYEAVRTARDLSGVERVVSARARG